MPGVPVEMLLQEPVRLWLSERCPDTRTILHRQLVQFSYEIVLTWNEKEWNATLHTSKWKLWKLALTPVPSYIDNWSSFHMKLSSLEWRKEWNATLHTSKWKLWTRRYLSRYLESQIILMDQYILILALLDVVTVISSLEKPRFPRSNPFSSQKLRMVVTHEVRIAKFSSSP